MRWLVQNTVLHLKIRFPEPATILGRVLDSFYGSRSHFRQGDEFLNDLDCGAASV